jgi:hypothetical protein
MTDRARKHRINNGKHSVGSDGALIVEQSDLVMAQSLLNPISGHLEREGLRADVAKRSRFFSTSRRRI